MKIVPLTMNWVFIFCEHVSDFFLSFCVPFFVSTNIRRDVHNTTELAPSARAKEYSDYFSAVR